MQTSTRRKDPLFEFEKDDLLLADTLSAANISGSSSLYECSRYLREQLHEVFLAQLHAKKEVEAIKEQYQSLGILASSSASAPVIDTIQQDQRIESQNHAHGAFGLSFCPYHKVCPDYHCQPSYKVQETAVYKRKCNQIKEKMEVQTEAKSTLAHLDFFKPLADLNVQKASFGVGGSNDYSYLLFADNPFAMSCLKRDFAKLSETLADQQRKLEATLLESLD